MSERIQQGSGGDILGDGFIFCDGFTLRRKFNPGGGFSTPIPSLPNSPEGPSSYRSKEIKTRGLGCNDTKKMATKT